MHQLYATYGSGNCYKAHLVMSQLDIAYETTGGDVLKGETFGYMDMPTFSAAAA